MTDHPMQPTRDQLNAWVVDADQPGTTTVGLAHGCARNAYAAGADAERRACIEVLDINGAPNRFIAMLCDRHPKSPSLKELALEALERQSTRSIPSSVSYQDCRLIQRALESIPDESP